MIPLRSCALVTLWFYVVFAFGCATGFPAEDSAGPNTLSLGLMGEKVKFRNLRSPIVLSIDLKDQNELEWRLGLDQGGGGYYCSGDHGFHCLVLDGLWRFSVPKAISQSQLVGHQWFFEGNQCRVEDIIPYMASDATRDIWIIACSEDGDTSILFGYSQSRGLEYVLEVEAILALEPRTFQSALDMPIKSVWLRE